MSPDLSLLVRAGHPVIAIESTDEDRALAMVAAMAAELPRPLTDWSLTKGLREVNCSTLVFGNVLSQPGPPAAALEHVLRSADHSIHVFRDFGPHSRDAKVHRLLRDFPNVGRERQATLILLECQPLPADLRRLALLHEIGWPSAAELEQVVRETYQRIKAASLYEVTSRVTRREMEQLIQALRGLTLSEAERVVASAIHQDHALRGDDLPRIIETKRKLLGSTGVLESVAADFDSNDIGGLENLKRWLTQRRDGYSQRARDFGLEPPRGVLILGVQGCGKSLCAKVVAADWKMPLLRLDPGQLYQKFIGESERHLRDALRQAEAMAPVVLWIDEIEKAFASATGDSADGGLSQRMFGSLLTWMQDHRHPIFIVATANDISRLPPELLRKGRFDEVFFVDLPNRAARERILAIHLERRKRQPDQFDLARLAEQTEGYSGAELEQLILAGLYNAFHAGVELTTAHLNQQREGTRSLAEMMPERLAQLRAWAADRCVPADEASP